MKKQTLLAPALGVVTAYMTMVPVRYTYAQTSTPNRNQWKAEMRKELAAERKSYKEETKDIRLKYKKVIEEGKITGISGTTLTVSKDSKTFTVLTDDKTLFTRKFGGKSMLGEFSVGDTVNVRGTFTDDGQTKIQAQFVRDISIQKRWASFEGTVKSKSGNSLVVTTVKRGDQTVIVGGETKLLNKAGGTISLDAVIVGNKVVVSGIWNSSENKLTITNKLKDLSL